MKNRIFIGLGLAIVLSAASGYRVTAQYPVAGDGGFDYVTLDESARRLYISHGNKVDVLDVDTGKSAGVIPETPGVHGIAIAPRLHRGFTSNGSDNSVSVFDTQTLKLIRKIEVGKGPDGIYFEPSTGRIFTNNHGSHDVTAIDAATLAVVGTVKLEGDGEQPIIANGLIYVNSEEANEVVVFHPQTLGVVKRLPIRSAKVPTGLAYDPATNRLFIACREQPRLIIMDATTGAEVANFPIGTGADWAHFDASSKRVLVSTAEGVLNVFHQKSANEFDQIEAIPTKPGARTMAFDGKTKRIYLPSAEYESAAESGKASRRRIRPGSFTILVLGN